MEIAMLSRSATVAEGVKSASTADGGKIYPGKICLGGGYRLPASTGNFGNAANAANAANALKINLGGGYRLPIQGG
jgi:hypothetical protein